MSFTNNTLVSVVVPCYNCASYIEETLESLRNQTFRDFEVVCVDDGSTDETSNLLEREKDRGALNLRIITQTNGGVSVARNRGIKESNGKYLLFLDSDDVYHRDFIKTLVEAKEKNQVDVAYCRLSRNLQETSAINSERGVNIQIQSQDQAMSKLLFEMGRYSFVCYLYEREKLLVNSLFFDENTKYGEDREFNWKYLTHCRSFVWIDQPLYGYRVNDNSATRKKASWRKTDLLRAVKRIEDYLEQKEVPFLGVFQSYMYARSMWAVAKTFAVSHDRELYQRLLKEYDIKRCMKRTAKDASKLVSFASVLFLVHPVLFYYVVGLK